MDTPQVCELERSHRVSMKTGRMGSYIYKYSDDFDSLSAQRGL